MATPQSVSTVSMVGITMVRDTSRLALLNDPCLLDKTTSLHAPRTVDRDATVRMSAIQTRTPSEVKSIPVSRDRSLRDHKAPPGPRAIDQDLTKRSAAPTLIAYCSCAESP